MTAHQSKNNNPQDMKTQNGLLKGDLTLDAVIVGAGFSGLYQLYSLREKLNPNTIVLEAGDGVGGTWYWNLSRGAMRSENHTIVIIFPRIAGRMAME